MKRISKLTICITLAAILLLSTACGGNTESANDTNNATTTPNTPRATATAATPGRFVETDITPPIAGWFTTLITPDGTLAAFDEGLRNRYDSADGGDTWVHSRGLGSGTNAFEDVRAAGFMPDGSLLVYLPGSGMTIIAAN
ncbi:MAG: hypothetical protein FWG38_03815, partial [Defluviitaleaceae bacterium]|nr:hypothetical protein [Defluviitaleaceae bacterium]